MAKITPIGVPGNSLLAEFGSSIAYRDCYARTVQANISLSCFIVRFYTSAAFRPERRILGLIGRGASDRDARKLASGEATRFAAWEQVERREHEILLRDFSGATASWLSVEPMGQDQTRLMLGSWVGRPDRLLVKTLMPFHRFYSRQLLRGARFDCSAG